MKKLTLLMLFALVSALPMWSYDFSDDSTGTTIYYNILSESECTVEVTYPNSSRPSSSSNRSEYSETSYIIPETVSYGGATYTVVAISEVAFYMCDNLISVAIGDNVTTIGEYAFYYCHYLTSLTIGKNVTEIGESSFSYCSNLTSVRIPASVTSIGRYAFECCAALEEIMVDEGNIYYSSDDYGVLFNKDKTTLICCPGASQTYTIPESVTTVEDYAFSMCEKLTSVTIGENVTIIGDKAFYYCTDLEGDLIIPDKVTSIGESAFWYCYKLTSVTFGSSVTTIGESAFWYCTSLTSATFGNSVETIERAAFYNCYKLTSVIFGSNVKTIGESAFYECSGLTSITSLNPTPPDCESYAFDRITPSNITLYVPKGCSSVYSSTSPWSDFGAIEELPGVGDKIFVDGFYYTVRANNCLEVTWNGGNEFKGTEEYTGDLVIPASVVYGPLTYTVTGIGGCAFANCTPTSVTIPASVTSIGYDAFFNCYELTSIDIPDNVLSLGSQAFSYCSGLETINWGSGLKTIDRLAFSDCTGLKEITIPDNVETIGDQVFWWCESLESATIGSGVKEMGWAVFCEDYSLTKLEVSEDNEYYCSVDNIIYTKDMTTLVQYALGLEAETYETPDNVTAIADGAFYGCCNLQSITLGNSVETIGYGVFEYCYALTSVTLGNSVIEIGDWSFCGCYALRTMTSLNPEPPTCDYYTFYDIDKYFVRLYVPAGSKDTYAAADVWCDFRNIEELPAVGDKIEVDGLCYTILSDTEAEVTYNTDDDGAISPYTQTSISIPESITRGVTYNVIGVGYWAFYGCENMTSIDLGSVTYIDEQAFRDCTSLSSIELPESLTKIGDYAFSGCSALTGELVIPDGVVTLGASAFTGCSGVTSVIIGSGVETIGDSAFQFCENLTSVTFGENVVSIGGTAFASTNLEGDLIIPDKVTTIGDWAFSGCSHLTSLTLGTSVETIGGSAFSSCSGLIYVTSLNTTPPTCVDDPFTYVYLSFLTLYVPVGTYDAYSTAAIWKDFWQIIEMTSFAISTLPATDVTYNSATLNGSLTPAYDDPIFEAGFEYWTDGGEVVKVVVEDEDLTATVSGLADDTTYTYHSYATMADGTAYGNDETFTTDVALAGIDAVSLNPMDVKAIYTHSGQQINATQKGLNIIYYNDGTVKKVMVK